MVNFLSGKIFYGLRDTEPIVSRTLRLNVHQDGKRYRVILREPDGCVSKIRTPEIPTFPWSNSIICETINNTPQLRFKSVTFNTNMDIS